MISRTRATHRTAARHQLARDAQREIGDSGNALRNIHAVADQVLSLHVRVGTKDALALPPYRVEGVESNVQVFELAKTLAEARGRHLGITPSIAQW